jgi:transcriptional regulator with XRE-family HTH domain
LLDDKYKKIFSKNLNYYMNLRGKTQTDIINDLDINKSAISSWCNGTRLPRMNKVELLANYLNINVSDLLGDNDENNNYFEYVAEDDSMYPLLDIGDIALIYKQDFITNNATHLIKLNNKNTMRKFILSNDKTYYTLVAMNGCFKDLEIKINDLDQIKVIGKVVKSENKSAFKN